MQWQVHQTMFFSTLTRINKYNQYVTLKARTFLPINLSIYMYYLSLLILLALTRYILGFTSETCE